jgi:glutamyl-tRNA synthetase
MNIITRFAPSPTGFLHIGGARTALFNYLFARNNGGKFLLRIEDTDQKRLNDDAVHTIINGLKWLELNNDDKIIFQSQNIIRHKEIAIKLLENEQAYYCYTSAEELQDMRQVAEKNGKVFRFQSQWRDKSFSQTSIINPVIRIKAPIEGETIIKDLVQGEVRVANSELDDLVMLRGDGTPTYMLAVVVDDYDMGITHIIRGDDHLTNSFRQKIIYQAMGWNIPEFAHIPLIHGPDGVKMSKRHGATSVEQYKKMGYLPDAIRNYLLRLGWSHGNDEIISDENAIKWFDMKNIGRSPSRFDFDKLDNLNKHYIKEKSEEELLATIATLLPKNISQNEKIKIIKALKFIKERANKIFDLVEVSQIYLNNFSKNLDNKDLEKIKNNLTLLKDLEAELGQIEEWNHNNIKDTLNNFSANRNLKIKDFAPILRIALTFSGSSAGGIFDVIDILGKDEVVKRLSKLSQHQS